MDRLFPEIVGNFRKLPESSAISGNFGSKKKGLEGQGGNCSAMKVRKLKTGTFGKFPAIATQTFRCHSWSLCNDTLDHIGFLVIW